MDIPALSTAMANSNLALQVGTKVLSINKDVMEQQGQALVVLLQQNLTPHLGGTIDIKL